MKQCTKCQIEKEETEYYKHKNGKGGLNPVCKICWKGENKIFETNNPRNDYRAKRYIEIKPQHNAKVAARSQERYKNDIEYKLLKLTRTRLHHFLKGKHKAEGTRTILGIDLTGYKEYLESKFTEGMSWENFGEWEIDHIIPVSKGGSFHYTNTQPLWMKENRQKSNK
jgi:5-methylcytosine-specific restriction endonuclease McrA